MPRKRKLTTFELHNFWKELEIMSICRHARGLSGAFAGEEQTKGNKSIFHEGNDKLG